MGGIEAGESSESGNQREANSGEMEKKGCCLGCGIIRKRGDEVGERKMPLVESCYSNSDAKMARRSRRCEHPSECEAAVVTCGLCVRVAFYHQRVCV